MTFAPKRDWSAAETMMEAAALTRALLMPSCERFRLLADYYEAIIAAKRTTNTFESATKLGWDEKISRRNAMNLAFAKLDAVKREKQTSTDTP